jgi:hypothetical protein
MIAVAAVAIAFGYWAFCFFVLTAIAAKIEAWMGEDGQ